MIPTPGCSGGRGVVKAPGVTDKGVDRLDDERGTPLKPAQPIEHERDGLTEDIK
jgi:hypothetical protein